MASSWEIETGHLVCRWCEIGQRAQYSLGWMQEGTEVHGSYLPPIPDFAAHSPFGGADWFLSFFKELRKFLASVLASLSLV